MVVNDFGTFNWMELNRFRKLALKISIGVQRLASACLSTVPLITTYLRGCRGSFEVLLKERFECRHRGANEGDINFESDEDPEDVSFP